MFGFCDMLFFYYNIIQYIYTRRIIKLTLKTDVTNNELIFPCNNYLIYVEPTL